MRHNPKEQHNFNITINDYHIEDVAEKIGSIFGEKGRAVGKAIDDLTKSVTIKIDTRDTCSSRGQEEA